MIQGMFIILALTMPVIALLRNVMGKRAQALMLKDSPEEGNRRVLSGKVSEKPANSTPALNALDSHSFDQETDNLRYKVAQDSLQLFRQWSVSAVIGVAAAFLLWQAFFLIVGGELENIIGVNSVAGLFIGLIVIRYFYYVGNFKDKALNAVERPGWFRRWILIAPEQIIKTLIHPKYFLYPLLIVVISIRAAANTFFGWQFWAGLAFLLPMIFHWRILKKANKADNHRLLILRVFGRDSNMDLTFGAIRRYWQHIGSSFTIVDPSYIRYKYRGHSENQISVAFFSCLAWALIFGTPEFNEWFFIGPTLSLVIIIGYGIATFLMYLKAPLSFAKSRNQIDGRINSFMENPRRWDLTFKDLDMYCFDNTWEEAVSAFTNNADVVLMDLRGFSEKNKGCETEINFLFDTVHLDKIVFLIDSENDITGVEKMILELWDQLKDDSPNLDNSEPKATVYNIQDQTKEDVKGLINALVLAAEKEAV